MWWQQASCGADARVWSRTVQHERTSEARAGKERKQQKNASGTYILLQCIPHYQFYIEFF
jgi:hypothetical protein